MFHFLIKGVAFEPSGLGVKGCYSPYCYIISQRMDKYYTGGCARIRASKMYLNVSEQESMELGMEGSEILGK